MKEGANCMEAIILDGKKLANEIEADLKNRVNNIIEATGITPCLATILVGNDPSSEIYVNMKSNACRRVGLESRKIQLSEDTTTEELRDVIEKLNQDSYVFGILLQHPVPKQINERVCFDKIDINKDVDGVTTLGFGKMSLGDSAFHSATPGGIMKLLEHYHINLEGKLAVIVGRSPILGKPMSMMMLNANATVIICHSKTKKLPELIKQADIVVGAVGIPEFIKADWIKEGAIVVDAGYHKGGLGDIEIEKVKEKCEAYTPVPGGVGPMTISTLISQTVEAAEKKLRNK